MVASVLMAFDISVPPRGPVMHQNYIIWIIRLTGAIEGASLLQRV
jgi:hypothetical protein